MYRLASWASASRTPISPGATPKREITSYLTELTQTPVRDFFRAEPMAEHARHSDRVSADRQARGFHDPSAAGGHAGRELRHLRPRLRAAGRPAGAAAAAKSISTPKSIKCAIWDLDRPDSLRAADRAGQPHPQRKCGAAKRLVARNSIPSTTISLSASASVRGRLEPHRGGDQSRSALTPRPASWICRSTGLRVEEDRPFAVPRPAHRSAAISGRQAELRRAQSFRAIRPYLRISSRACAPRAPRLFLEAVNQLIADLERSLPGSTFFPRAAGFAPKGAQIRRVEVKDVVEAPR